MRIIHLSCVAPPEIGGIGSVALREVAGLRGRGIDARLIAPEMVEGQADTDTRGFVERLPAWRLGNGAVLKGLSSKINQADVIHLHYPFFGVAEWLLWRRRRIPVVMTFHMDATPQGWKGVVAAFQRLLIQPFLLSHAATVLVSSYDYAQRSSLEPWYAAHPDRVKELPFGVDTEVFCPGPAVRPRFMIPENAPTFIFVGGLDKAHSFKGIFELLLAFSKIEPSAHLMVVGEGDLRPAYEEQARTLGVSLRVHFLGRLDQATLVDAYRSADVFVFPSTTSAEAFGLAALEAEACGKPVIASDLPGVRTVVQQGVSGLLVQPKNIEGLSSAMASLTANPEQRIRMGDGARRLAVERFSWEKHLDGLIEVYQKVCGSRS